MARRKTTNKTGIPRLPNVPSHSALASYSCVACHRRNFILIGGHLPKIEDVYQSNWECEHCGFEHNLDAELPFETWPDEACSPGSEAAQSFWRAFFRSATEKNESYWKQCKTCGRLLPNLDFSRHVNWGPLEKQLECKACKAVINSRLNPSRTTEQLRESGFKRRIAELLVEQGDQKLNLEAIFERFDSRCFKTGHQLNIDEKDTYQIDHTLPSRYFYPLSEQNATLLSTAANQEKSGKWPSEYYTNQELRRLCKITGASLVLLSSKQPIINENIDVDLCVSKFLRVRENSDLHKRVEQLKILLNKHQLVDKLSSENKRILGIS